MSKFLLEYYEGDPDTIDEYDDETRQLIKAKGKKEGLSKA